VPIKNNDLRYYEIRDGLLNQVSHYRGVLQVVEISIDLPGTNYFVNVEYKTGLSKVDYLLDDDQYDPTTRIWFNNTNEIDDPLADGDWIKSGVMLGNNKDFMG
jgi:hypothetical protein